MSISTKKKTKIDSKDTSKMYHWFFTDIVASADPRIPSKDQIERINVLNHLIKKTRVFSKRDPKSTFVLPTGDGVVIGFADSPETPLKLAIDLHKAITQYNKGKRKNKLLIRTGIDLGPVFSIKHINGNDAYWGPGLLRAKRVMDIGDEMHILTSETTAKDLRNLSSYYKEIIHSIGSYSIKHGETLGIYNIYARDFGNKKPPQLNKIRKIKESEKPKEAKSFQFARVEIKLEVKDPKSMLVHHTWIWNIHNTSKESLTHIFYSLGGDVPKKFPDMNVEASDENGDNLEISNIVMNRPTEKRFHVKPKKPIKPRQRNKIITMEYDWEEPERYYEYNLPVDCKNFKYVFSMPKGIEVKNRVLNIEPKLGYMWDATPAPTIKYLANKTIITWETKNLKEHQGFRFQW